MLDVQSCKGLLHIVMAGRDLEKKNWMFGKCGCVAPGFPQSLVEL